MSEDKKQSSPTKPRDESLLLGALEAFAASKKNMKPPMSPKGLPTSPKFPSGEPAVSPLTPTPVFADAEAGAGDAPNLTHPLLSGGADQGKPPRANGGAGKPGHNRTVSWNVEKPPMVVRAASKDGDTSQLSPTQADHRSVASRISLRALMEASPFETEAETYIQSTLDEVDPTRPNAPMQAQQTILGNVPDEAKDNFTTPAAAAQAPAKLPLFRKATTGHKKTKSTAEDLWSLTRDLQRLQSTAGGSFTASTVSNKSDDEEPATDVDALVSNAAKLMKRHKASIAQLAAEREEEEESEAAAVPAVSASDRWKKLKTTVNTTSAFDTKKTDEPSPGEKAEDDEQFDVEVGAEGDVDEEGGLDGLAIPSSGHGNGRKAKRNKIKSTYKDFEDWLKVKKVGAWTYIKYALFFLMIPATLIAAALFYFAGNPPCGDGVCKPRNGTVASELRLSIFVSASASWWLLFICVRQVVTFSLAHITERFLVEFMSVRTKWSVRLFGPFMTLFLVQGQGWPITLFWWGVYDFILLYGGNSFAKHWLFWQDVIRLFGKENPAGTILVSAEYKALLIVSIVISFMVVVKRCWVGLFLGRQTFGKCLLAPNQLPNLRASHETERYGDDLAKVMKKSVLIGQVATLARDIEKSNIDLCDFGVVDSSQYVLDETASGQSTRNLSADDGMRGNILAGMDLSSRRARVAELLGEWDEPEMLGKKAQDHGNIGAIIQFRQSLTYLNSSMPFSVAFGLASTREECVAASEDVYNRLLLGMPGALVLKFDAIALLALHKNGELDEDKLRDFIRLFRPDREGNLTLLDFAKSIDVCYKELRLLRASVASSSKMDQAVERIVNLLFYFIAGCIVLSAVGVDPLVLFASISGFVLGFAFMIGAACSKYFEGVMMILVRRPYSIGDRINVSLPNQDTPGTGSPGWIVKDVDLYTTTVLYASTNEVATVSNGALATMKIINAARSPKASLNFLLKFHIDTSYNKLMVFKSALEKFCKARPREWAAFLAFRATRVEADLGFVEYIVVAQHRESWQNTGACLQSKAELSSFALELSKRMDMRYTAPPMPVDLTMKSDAMPSIPENASNDGQQGHHRRNSSLDIGSVEAMFQTK